MTAILDTSVLVDIVLESRPRHSIAKRLGEYLSREGLKVRCPYFSLFELGSAIKQEIAAGQPIKVATFLSEDFL